MWVVNVVLIFAAIAVISVLSWLLWNYRGDLTKALGFLYSGGQSLLFALGVILLEAVKAAIVAALVGGFIALIFFIAGAPTHTSKVVSISIAGLAFALLMIKALWENLNNLRWSIRNEIRNRYRKR
jgi:hypothetical protein